MDMVKISHVKSRLIKNLSKGYKQRVGFAQAIVGYPEVIILDEPTVGLDPKQIIEIRELIKDLGSRHTVILSSHILSEVSAVCDHIMIISKGNLVASDTPEGLMKMMTSKKEIKLSVIATEEELTNILNEISRITEYSFVSADNDNVVSVNIKTEASDDIREELFYKLADNKMPIMELVNNEKSLEDVFLELTGEHKGDKDDETINCHTVASDVADDGMQSDDDIVEKIDDNELEYLGNSLSETYKDEMSDTTENEEEQ